MWVGGQRHSPVALPPGEIRGTHYIGDWVDPKADMDGCEKSLFHWDNSIDIATRYGLDGPGIISRWERDFPPLEICYTD